MFYYWYRYLFMLLTCFLCSSFNRVPATRPVYPGMRVTGRIHYIVVSKNLASGYLFIYCQVIRIPGVMHVRQKLCGNLTFIPVLGSDFMIHFLESSFHQNVKKFCYVLLIRHLDFWLQDLTANSQVLLAWFVFSQKAKLAGCHIWGLLYMIIILFLFEHGYLSRHRPIFSIHRTGVSVETMAESTFIMVLCGSCECTISKLIFDISQPKNKLDERDMLILGLSNIAVA